MTDYTIVPISNQLAKIPAFAQVAAMHGIKGHAAGLDGLAVRYPDGTETYHSLPAGSRPWLRTIFPHLSWRHEYDQAADGSVWAIRFSEFQNALLTRTHSRLLCVRTCKILS